MAYDVTFDDIKAGTSLGYSYTKDGNRVNPDRLAMLTNNTVGGYINTSEEGVMYDVNTGEYRRVGATAPVEAPKAAPAPALKGTMPSGGGGSGGAKAPAAVYTPPKIEEPEPFRANVKTGQEAGGDFKLFQGDALKDKTGMTADRLRIGGVESQGTGRDIKKKKQLDTLGLNVASAVGLGI